MADAASPEARLRDAWRRTDEIFDRIDPGALLERPISLRQPFIFYLGHLPAFGWNQVCRLVLGRAAFAPELDVLFERGIDPPDVADYRAPEARWPESAAVREYRDRVRRELGAALPEVVKGGRADLVERVLEHEWMHQETLLYMLLQLPHDRKRRPAGLPPPPFEGGAPAREVEVPAGRVTLGAPRDGRFGWDNEFPEQETSVASFRIDALPVRNAEFLEFVDAGGYDDPRLWDEETWAWLRKRGQRWPAPWSRPGGKWLCRGLFEDLPLETASDWPACVTWAEARAFARWRGGRLPTEAEYQRAAYGNPGREPRAHPWGDAPPSAEHGNFGLRRWSPAPVGTHPAGASAWGVQDLVGDGWEWTATPFAPFPGFEPMRGYEGYSADFFDEKHRVLLGASWATPDGLVRKSFRNWFQPHYPYVFAKFRCVRDAAAAR